MVVIRQIQLVILAMLLVIKSIGSLIAKCTSCELVFFFLVTIRLILAKQQQLCYIMCLFFGNITSKKKIMLNIVLFLKICFVVLVLVE